MDKAEAVRRMVRVCAGFQPALAAYVESEGRLDEGFNVMGELASWVVAQSRTGAFQCFDHAHDIRARRMRMNAGHDRVELWAEYVAYDFCQAAGPGQAVRGYDSQAARREPQGCFGQGIGNGHAECHSLRG